jgi:glycosyltransferase involved in cell wall biosynthesis
MPDVSVIIPTYNRIPFLKKSVESCFEGNDDLRIEVVIVDDGSTDGTREWIYGLNDDRITYLRQTENQGAQVARNTGLQAASGDTIKFLDSDDFLYPGLLLNQWRVLNETGDDVCYGSIDIVKEEGRVHKRNSNPAVEDLLAGIMKGEVSTYPHVFLYQSEVARRAKWQPEVPYHQDTVYALNIAARDPSCVQVDTCIGVHRIHEGSRITTTRKRVVTSEKVEKRFEYFVAAFQQRRQQATVSDDLRGDIAHGLWRSAHKMAPHDFGRFVSMYEQIRDISPDFSPPRSQSLLRMFDRMIGPVLTERIINPLRILKLNT